MVIITVIVIKEAIILILFNISNSSTNKNYKKIEVMAAIKGNKYVNPNRDLS